jgi:hypothetical protein
MYFFLKYIVLNWRNWDKQAHESQFGSPDTSVIVADRDPLVVCRVNSTLGAETDSNIAASCGAAAKSKPSAIRDIELVDTSMPGLSEHRRMKELEGGPKIADANASRYQRGQT